MLSFVLIGVCLQLSWSHGSSQSQGVGAFSYQDSTGNRYGGTYGLKDGEVVDAKGTFPPDFSPPTFNDPEDFFPEYFRNLQNLLQDQGYFYPPVVPYIPPTFSYLPRRPEYNTQNDHFNINRAFQANIENQKLALDAARKAFDLTSNQAGYIPNLNPTRFPFNDFPAYGGFADMPQFPFQGFPNFGNRDGNSAYAGAAVGPDFQQQVAFINPANPNMPNINKMSAGSGPGGYKQVSVSSYSTSSDVDGRRVNKQGAKTTINDNGNIKTYETHSP